MFEEYTQIHKINPDIQADFIYKTILSCSPSNLNQYSEKIVKGNYDA